MAENKENSILGGAKALPLASALSGGYGLRPDGSPKGKGFLGEHKMTDGSGRVMTEYSVGFNFGGKEMDVPTLVPTLNQEELNHLRAGNQPTPEILQKARQHAEMRISQGKSPFADKGEEGKYQPIPLKNKF